MAEVLRGSLTQLPLLDILKMLSSGNKTGRLDLRQGSKTGEIYLQDGNLIHAVTGPKIGEKGLFALLGWLEGEFSFSPNIDAPEQSISLSTEQMLLEGARQAEQWEDIKEVISSTDAIFDISPSGSTDTVSLKPIEWQVLTQVNGQRSIIDIAEILELNEFEVAKIIFSLTIAGLLHEVDHVYVKGQAAGDAFFEQLTEYFTDVMGPLGPMIIDDEIRLLGEDRASFPQDKAAELVERISLEIADGVKRAQFQKQMVAVLKR